MRQKTWVLAVVLFLSVFLSACGAKTPEDVIDDLRNQPDKMKSYISHGKLTIQSNKKPQVIDVEVWYKRPNMYRVQLKNETNNITQILLKNDQGVYVLTPHLKKSYRFQSDWPATSGQVYLYQTILSSIVEDGARKMEMSEKGYQFEVKTTKYMNTTWTKQRIWLDTDYRPQKVEVYNEKEETVVKMSFDRFETNAKFDSDAFDSDRNLTGTPSSSKETFAGNAMESKELTSAITPGYIPQESQLSDEHTIQGPKGSIVVLRFKGKQPFTLSQQKPRSGEVIKPVYGKPLDIHGTVGVLLELKDHKSLSWVDLEQNVEYELVSSLQTEEMVKIATSIKNQPSK